MKREITLKNQQRLDSVAMFGIDIKPIVEKYGSRFALKLIKNVTWVKNRYGFKAYPQYPNVKLTGTELEKFNELFLQELKQIGFKFRRWNEDFVDEDTGEVVSIERWEIYCLCSKHYGKI